MNLGRILVSLGVLALVVGRWAMVSEGHRKGWGLLMYIGGVFALPFYPRKHWREARIPISIELTGLVMIITGSIIGTE